MVGLVAKFKYLGWPLEQTDNNLPNVKRECGVWGRLGDMLRRKGLEPKVVAMFYRSVKKAVLLFGSYTCVLLASMDRTVEGTHTGFLGQITGKQMRRKAERT